MFINLYGDTFEMMAATIVHEVKNPLALFMANLDYIKLCDTNHTYEALHRSIRNKIDQANKVSIAFATFFQSQPNIEQSASKVQYKTIEMANKIIDPLTQAMVEVEQLETLDISKTFAKNLIVMKTQISDVIELVTNFFVFFQPDIQRDERVDLCALLQRTIAYHDILPTNNIRFHLQFPDDYPETPFLFLGNERFFGIVLSNIIKNSVEAISHEGLISISVSCFDQTLLLEISDTGTGIPPEIMTKIDSDDCCTTKRYGNGLGIGICKKIVADHNGTYQIKNLETGGCRVTIQLPLLSDPPKANSGLQFLLANG